MPRERRSTHRETPVKWWRIIPATIAALTIPFAIGYVIAVYMLFPAPKVEPGSNGIPVPDLVGRSYREARDMLATAGLGELDTIMLAHASREAGTILAQDPLPGQQLRRGARVSASVSSGTAMVRVPNVEGFTADAAEQVLKRMGFETQRSEETSSMQAGTVTRVEPMSGATVKLPTTVVIWISTGMPVVDSFTVRNARPDTIMGEWQ
jgi:serine/threonine-protein kinase